MYNLWNLLPNIKFNGFKIKFWYILQFEYSKEEDKAKLNGKNKRKQSWIGEK